jgi:hypothetical protein
MAAAVLLVLAAATLGADGPQRVQVTPNEAARRVDVTIDGKPFTSYIWPTTLKKPVLYPLRTAKGTIVTRTFPPDPAKKERTDHPHHVGMWFNHGDVNGFDFWNNSDAIPKDREDKMGTILQKKIVEAKSGADRGELAVETAWVVPPNDKALLREQTRFIFRGTPESRVIDRITTLTALDERVVFNDNKESTLGIRVARGLEQPDPKLDNTGVTGEYISSEGRKGDAVWGTRGRWTLLGGTVDGEAVTMAILDNPSNPGFPTYWHARGYGLFAANPLGQKALSNGKEELNLTLEPGKSTTFKYRILILTGKASPDDIERQYKAFAQEGS